MGPGEGAALPRGLGHADRPPICLGYEPQEGLAALACTVSAPATCRSRTEGCTYCGGELGGRKREGLRYCDCVQLCCGQEAISLLLYLLHGPNK